MKSGIENIIVLVILSLILITFLFFFLTLFKKLRRIKKQKRQKIYQEKIETFLFGHLFGDLTAQAFRDDPQIKHYRGDRLFQKIAIKSLISLHHNYSGEYSKKLELFFIDSGLLHYSISKLNSKKWSHVVEAIKDLSSLNYQPAYARIISLQNHKNQFVQTEVLLGIIKLKGVAEILKFSKSKIYLNDWVQSNILFAVKKHRIEAPDNLPQLLHHPNTSFVILAVRLINYYKNPVHYGLLSQFYRITLDEKLKKEIIPILRKTEQLI